MNNINKTKYNFVPLVALILIPFIGILGTIWYIYNYGIIWQEPILLIAFWIVTGLSITVGYHRLFSHKSFKAHPILEWFLAIAGSAALENSILKWSSDHRQHHKHLDTDEDPYSITKGFFYAHIGWIIKGDSKPIKHVKDLEEKNSVIFQYKFYIPLFIIFGIILPVSIGFLWGRPFGAMFWGVFLRITLVHHFTYSINSICHYFGKRPYDYRSTSRDSWYAALLTFGEGYHNYHHKFQWDYRNGIRWFDFDPSKWFIWLVSKVGLAKELKKVDQFRIYKAKSSNFINQINEKLDLLPMQIKHSYSEKLNLIKRNLHVLEIDYKDFITRGASELSKKKYRNQQKIHNIEFKSILSSLSLLLTAIVQSKQF